MRRLFRQFVRELRSLQSFRRQLKRPSDYQRDRKADDEEENYEAHNPIGDVEKWKNLAGNLHQQPGDNAVRDRNLVNVAPLQLSEEVFRVHSADLDEALVTAALYLYACDLKSTCTVKNNLSAAPDSSLALYEK